MNIQEGISLVASNKDLSQDQMSGVMLEILGGNCTDAQIGAFLVALSIKGETVDEVVGAANSMRQLSVKVPIESSNLVDTCGTGGTAIGVFNVSTTSSFVASDCGAKVAKHGNRTVTRLSLIHI